VADTVIMMQSYVPQYGPLAPKLHSHLLFCNTHTHSDVTAEAKDIAARVKSELDNEGGNVRDLRFAFAFFLSLVGWSCVCNGGGGGGG
jgi:hypothetical protein